MKKTWLILFILMIFAVPLSATEIVEEQDEKDVSGIGVVVREDHILKEKFKQPEAKPFRLLGVDILPGSRQTLQLSFGQATGGFTMPSPVLIVHGAEPGPVVCLTAAIHGDELNGIEITRQVIHGLNPEKLKGTVVGVPVVNVEGLLRKERYIGDRRDLNRYFPGTPDGSYAGRVAHLLFQDIVSHCDALVDLHTGSFYRENLPQLRADLTIPQVAEMIKGFGALTALQSMGPTGSLRSAATSAGIPAVVMEIGGPLSLETEHVELGVKSVQAFLSSLGMIGKVRFWSTPQPVFYESKWLRAEQGGILISGVSLGEKVEKGKVLAEITDPVSNKSHKVEAPFDGVILGKAQNQFVSPGFAVFRIGMKRTITELEKQGENEKKAVIKKQANELGITPEADSGKIVPPKASGD